MSCALEPKSQPTEKRIVRQKKVKSFPKACSLESPRQFPDLIVVSKDPIDSVLLETAMRRQLCSPLSLHLQWVDTLLRSHPLGNPLRLRQTGRPVPALLYVPSCYHRQYACRRKRVRLATNNLSANFAITFKREI